MRYKAAIFDMDGTTLDTLEDLAASLNHALAACGLPRRTIDEVRSFVGNGIRNLVELGVPEGTETAMADRVFEEFNAHYVLHCADSTKPYEGVVEAVKELRGRGIKTAIVSNKADYAVKSLCESYFPGLFDYCVGAREGIRKKPWPDSVNAALAFFGLKSSDAVYIGDSEVDVMTAKNSGTDAILVDWGFRSRQELKAAGAEKIVSDVRKMLELIIE